MHKEYRLSDIKYMLQIAVYQDDGSPYVNSRHRQVIIYTSVRKQGSNVRTLPKEVKIIPDNSIVQYSYTPGADDEMIVIRVSIHSRHLYSYVNSLAPISKMLGKCMIMPFGVCNVPATFGRPTHLRVQLAVGNLRSFYN